MSINKNSGVCYLDVSHSPFSRSLELQVKDPDGVIFWIGGPLLESRWHSEEGLELRAQALEMQFHGDRCIELGLPPTLTPGELVMAKQDPTLIQLWKAVDVSDGAINALADYMADNGDDRLATLLLEGIIFEKRGMSLYSKIESGVVTEGEVGGWWRSIHPRFVHQADKLSSVIREVLKRYEDIHRGVNGRH